MKAVELDEDLERLKVALRVLAAATELRKPEKTDIQARRSYATLVKHGLPAEMACEVIQQVLMAQGKISDLTKSAGA